MNSTKARKITVTNFCEKHAGSFLAESRRRRIEAMAEGGWSNGGFCEGGVCVLLPGRDVFCESECFGPFELDWTTAK